MANVLTKQVEIPLPDNYPCPVRRVGDYVKYKDGYFRGAEIYPDNYDSNKKGIVFYFHGSGAAATTRNSLTDAINEKGYTFIGINELNHGNSGPYTYRSSYGNLNMVDYQSRIIRLAWWVKAVLDFYRPRLAASGEKFIVLSHSMGATATLAYLAGYADYAEKTGTHAHSFGPGFRGVAVNGATMGGLGNLSWNDINNNINCMSQVFRLAQDANVKKVIMYADDDAYAPPDYVKRLQLSLKPDNNTYLISAGKGGHTWLNKNAEYADKAATVVDNLFNSRVNLFNGKPAEPIK